MASHSPFYLFKDPSKVQFSGSTTLTGNQLQGFGGFDPRISIGGDAGLRGLPGTRGVFFDGNRVGSTSEKNIFESPVSQGFSIFSTGANSQTVGDVPDTTTVSSGDDAGALPPVGEGNTTLPTDPVLQDPPPTVIGDGSREEVNSNFFDPVLTDFITSNFGSADYVARFGSIPGQAFRRLGTDPVTKMLISGQQPSPEQMTAWRTRFIAEMERLGANTTTIFEVIGGEGGGEGVFDFFPQSPGPHLDPRTGTPGLDSDIDAANIRIEDIIRTLSGVGFGTDFRTSLTDVQGQLGQGPGGILNLLGQVGESPIPGRLSDSLGVSQDILRELVGGSFGEGFQPGLLQPAIDQGTKLGGILDSLVAPPDLGGPLDDARAINELFTIGGQQVQDLGRDVGALQRGGVAGLSKQLEELGIGGLEDAVGSFERNQLPGLEDALSRLNIGGLEGQLAGVERDVPGLQGLLSGLNIGGLEDQIGGLQRNLLPGLESQLGDLNLRGLEDQFGAFERQTLPGFQDLLGDLNLRGLEDQFGAFERQTLPGFQDLLGDLNLRGLEDQFGAFERQDVPGLQGLLDELNLGGLGTQFGAFERQDIPGLQGKLDELNLGGLGTQFGAFERQDVPGLQGLLDELNLGGLGTQFGAFERQDIPGLQGKLDELNIGGLERQLTDAGILAGPLNDLLAGIQAGDFEGLQALLEQAGGSFQIPGLGDLQTDITTIGGQITGLEGTIPLETKKIIDLINKRRDGGGGATDLTGINDTLADILAQLAQGGGGAAEPTGVFKELMDAIRGDFTRPTTAEELRQDPITASILADQQEANRRREKDDRELLQRFGVIRGGDSINLANLRAEDQSRSRLAALGQGAQRADERFRGAISSGTTLAGQIQAKRLADAGLSGFLDGGRTIAGQTQDQALLAQIIALGESEFNPFTSGDPAQLALVEGLLPLLPPAMQKAIRDSIEKSKLGTA